MKFGNFKVKMSKVRENGSHWVTWVTFLLFSIWVTFLGHIWVTTSIYGNMASDVINDIVSKHVKQRNWMMKLGIQTNCVMENTHMMGFFQIDDPLGVMFT